MFILMSKHFLFIFLLQITGGSNAQPTSKKNTFGEYIEQYKLVAVQDMITTGVPASITLAQASLESDNGNSPLAQEANNHFGIKCHDWNGKKYFYDDDERQECFRKYTSALESFDDHSYFLKNRQRYSFLFDIPKTDYKAWAYGLKKAGYATNPVYAEKLIKIIEDNKLYELDKLESIKKLDQKVLTNNSEKKPITINSRTVSYNNGVRYTQSLKNDSYQKIAEENKMRLWQIIKYNDLPKNAKLSEGQKLYLQPKRRKPREEFHIVQNGETMYTISQKYAVKIKFLYRRNRMKPGEAVKNGQKLWLRKKKKITD